MKKPFVLALGFLFLILLASLTVLLSGSEEVIPDPQAPPGKLTITKVNIDEDGKESSQAMEIDCSTDEDDCDNLLAGLKASWDMEACTLKGYSFYHTVKGTYRGIEIDHKTSGRNSCDVPVVEVIERLHHT